MDGGGVVQRIVFDRIGDGQGMGVLRSSFDDHDVEESWHKFLKPHYGLFGRTPATSYLEFPAGAVVLHRFVSANTGRNPSVALVGRPEHLAERAPYVRFDHADRIGEAGPLTLDELERRSPVDGCDEHAARHHEHALPVLAALVAGLGSPVSVVGTPPDAIPSVVHLVRRVLSPVLGGALPLTFSESERDDDSRSRPGLPALVFLSEWPSDTEVVEHARIRAADPPRARAELAAFLLDAYAERREHGPAAYAEWVERAAAGGGGPEGRVALLDGLRAAPRAPAPVTPGGGSPALSPHHPQGLLPDRTPWHEDIDDDLLEDLNERTIPIAPLVVAGAAPPALAPPSEQPSEPVRTARPPSAPPHQAAAGRSPTRRPAPEERPWVAYLRRRRLRAEPPRRLQELIEDWADSPSHDDELEHLLADRYGPSGRWLHAHRNVETLARLVGQAPAGFRTRVRRFAQCAGAGARFDAAVGAVVLDRELPLRALHGPLGWWPRARGSVRAVPAGLRGWWYRNMAALTGSAIGGGLVFVAGFLAGRGT